MSKRNTEIIDIVRVHRWQRSTIKTYLPSKFKLAT